MSGYLATPLDFIVRTLFQLYILAVMLRFLLGWARASFYNPVAQFLVKVTNPPLLPLRRVIPGFFGVDLAAVALMFALQVLALWLIALIWAAPLTLGTLLAGAVVELIELVFNVFIISIFIQAILSWINPGSYNPVSSLLGSLTEPLLRPARRLIPPISGFDLSPLAVIILLQVLKMLVIPLLRHLAALV
jgi:YggT family protein